MFDQKMYTVLANAAYSILQRNGGQLGREFCEGFMFDHDINNGQSSARNAQQMFNYVATEVQRRNGGRTEIRDDQQLFEIVGNYINEIFRVWASRRQGGGGGMFGGSGGGGFGQPSMGFGNNGGSMFGGNRGGGGFGFGQQPRPGPSSHLIDDVIEPQGAQRQAAPAPVATGGLDFAASAPKQEAVAVTNYSFNPLDEIPDTGVDFSLVDEPVSWGITNPKDTSIVMVHREALKTRDERYVIRRCDGFERIYFNDPMDVAKDFFRVVPDYFLAEPFIFRLFYNHIEEVAIPTQDFIEVRKKFVNALSRERDASIYNTLISVIDQMLHGPRKALVTYLVAQINRALYLSCGMSEHPVLRIRFTQIEDLEELLGTNFQNKILEVPNGRMMIANIVNTAILNAMTGYSDVMFTSEDDMGLDVIKNSPVFPHNLPGVYPNKAAIPAGSTPLARKFFEALTEHQLSQKTFVRSIRSIIFTNVLGQKALPMIGEKPTAVAGQIPALFNEFVLDHIKNVPYGESRCRHYDEPSATGKGAEVEYAQFLESPDKYAHDEQSYFIDLFRKEVPSLPVDQMIMAIQYKKSPNDYLAAFDLLTTMDAPRQRSYALFASKKLGVLKPTV